MNGKKNLMGIIFLSILLILIPHVLSFRSDFIATMSSSELSACSCKGTEFSLLLQNTGTGTETFTIMPSGDGASWITPLQNAIDLDAGESAVIGLMVRPLCGSEDAKSLSLTILSSGGTEKVIPLTIASSVCRNLEISQLAISAPSCPCTVQQFSFQLENLNGYTETYQFYDDPNPEWLSFSQNPVILESGETLEVFGYVNAPCDVYGDHVQEVSVVAETSGYEASFGVPITILGCYGYDSYVGMYEPVTVDDTVLFKVHPLPTDQLSVCTETVSYFPYVIRNDAPFTNQYDMRIEGPEWVWIDAASVFSMPGQNAVLNLFAMPPRGTEGIYQVDLYSTSRLGDVAKKSTVFLNTGGCYDFSIEFDQDEITTCCHSFDVEAVVRNKGTATHIISLNVSGMDAFLDKQTLQLDPGDNETVMVSLLPSCDSEYINHTTVSIGASIVEENVYATRTDAFSLTMEPSSRCYDLDVRNRDSRWNSNTVSNKWEVKQTRLEVENLGMLESDYALSVDGPIWVDIEPALLTLGAGESANVTLTVEPFEDVEKGSYPIGVLASLYGDNLTYAFDFVVKVGGNGFFGSYLFYILLALLLLLIILAILIVLKKRRKPVSEEDKAGLARKRKEQVARENQEKRDAALAKKRAEMREDRKKIQPYQPSRRGVLGVILILLLLLLAVLLLAYTGFFSDMFPSQTTNETMENMTLNETGAINATPVVPVSPEGNVTENMSPVVEPQDVLEEGFLYQVWTKDTPHTINMYEAFSDPDNDSLYFHATSADNFSITFDENGIATVVPDSGYLGRGEVYFTASDGKSAPVASPRVVFEVVEKEESFFSLSPEMRFYGTYFVVGIVLLIVIILVMRAGEKKTARKRVIVRRKN